MQSGYACHKEMSTLRHPAARDCVIRRFLRGNIIMVRSRSLRGGALAGWATAVLCTLALTSPAAFGQGSTTATLRGNVQDSTGGVLPGATVTLTNTATT